MVNDLLIYSLILNELNNMQKNLNYLIITKIHTFTGFVVEWSLKLQKNMKSITSFMPSIVILMKI